LQLRGSSPRVASDQAKPRGLLWVAPGSEARFLAPLSVRKIPGIGEVTERALRALSIETVEQLAAQPLEKLEKVFGQWAPRYIAKRAAAILRIHNRCGAQIHFAQSHFRRRHRGHRCTHRHAQPSLAKSLQAPA